MANVLTQFDPPFDALLLDCVLAASGKANPTEAELAAGLREVYPNGGPTVAAVLAAGWLEPTIDKKRLRVPPMSQEEQQHRLAEASPIVRTTEALFSYYRGGITAIRPHGALTPAGLHAELISTRHRAQTEALRAAPVDSSQRKDIKNRFNYVTPAGIFTQRANKWLVRASGLLVLDFDDVHDLATARAALLADADIGPALVLLFTSPSGNGLKAIVETDPAGSHLENFRYCEQHLTEHYAELGLIPDKCGKDVARACYVPYDPIAWLAPTFAA